MHDLLLPFFPEWTGLRHVAGMDHADQISRMHVELLYVLARKKKLDLFEIASLLNIGHISAAEMVDALIDKGLVQAHPKSEPLKIEVSAKVRRHITPSSGFMPIKEVVRHGKNSKYSLFSEKALQGKSRK